MRVRIHKHIFVSHVHSLAPCRFLDTMERSNPQLAALFAAQPGMREVMRRPELLSAMLNTMGGALPAAPPTAGTAPGAPAGGAAPNPMAAMMAAMAAGGGAPPPPMDFEALARLLGGPQGGGNAYGAPLFAAPEGPPEQVYATQLAQMAEMGMSDVQRNVRALMRAGGDVQLAIELIYEGHVA